LQYSKASPSLYTKRLFFISIPSILTEVTKGCPLTWPSKRLWTTSIGLGQRAKSGKRPLGARAENTGTMTPFNVEIQ